MLDPDTDRRQKRPLNRRVDSLEEDQKLFIRLLRTLRHKNDHVDGLLDYIRGAKPRLEQIKQYMDQQLPQEELEKTPELLELYKGLAARPTGRALSIARLCDIPPYSGPAKPWTIVTNDDQFVSHLISLYFIWSCLAFNFIDRDLFLRDFNSGEVNSLHCSPFLVNAMLADACVSACPACTSLRKDILTVKYLVLFRLPRILCGPWRYCHQRRALLERSKAASGHRRR